MKGYLYIGDEKIGDSDLRVIDESMGGIGGILSVNGNYQKYRKNIQQHFEEKGISNSGLTPIFWE